jgi:hypothetical protein
VGRRSVSALDSPLRERKRRGRVWFLGFTSAGSPTRENLTLLGYGVRKLGEER